MKRTLLVAALLLLLSISNVLTATPSDELLEHAAALGRAEAQYELGMQYLGKKYLEGTGRAKDLGKAMQWLEAAANQGYPAAQYQMAITLHQLDSDDARALMWVEKAARQAYPPACSQLGIWYMVAQGGASRDLAKSLEWSEKAARLGDSRGQGSMCTLYSGDFRDGQDLPTDRVVALAWCYLSFAQGDIYSSAGREGLESKLTSAEVTEARRLASTWKLGELLSREGQPRVAQREVPSGGPAKAIESQRTAKGESRADSATEGTTTVPVCRRGASVPWENFFCRYMTETLWVAAGRPPLPDPRDGVPWTPLFYRRGAVCVGECAIEVSASPTRPGQNPLADGLLEGFQRKDSAGGNQPIRRYAPWSAHIKSALGCSNDHVANPYRLSSGQVPRAQLLGLGWAGLARDAADPTDALDPGAMFILYTAANLGRLYSEPLANRIGASTLYTIGHGSGPLAPDYGRNAALSLVALDGHVEAVTDPSKAVELAASGVVVFVNDVLRNEVYAHGEARALGAQDKQPILSLYLAQDLFTPQADNDKVRAALRSLAAGTAERGASLNVAGHGWGGFVAVTELFTFPNVRIRVFNPYPNPWHLAEYSRALDESKAKVDVIAGSLDFVMMLGGGPGVGDPQPDPAACW